MKRDCPFAYAMLQSIAASSKVKWNESAIAQEGFSGMAEVLEFLASLPTPEAIIALRPSKSLQAQISTLLEKNRTVGLTPAEEQQWQGYQYLEHIVRMAKARAFLKLKEAHAE